LSALRREKSRDKGEQRTLAGAVEPEQSDKGCRRNREAHLGKGLTLPIRVAYAFDRQGGWGSSTRLCLRVALYGDHHGSALKRPRGRSPTWIILTTFNCHNDDGNVTDHWWQTILLVGREGQLPD